MQVLNNNEIGLHFTFEVQHNNVNFLDLNIRKGEDGRLVTCTFRKPTSSNNLLHWNSFHSVPQNEGYLRDSI